MKRAFYMASLLLLVAALHGQQPAFPAQTDLKKIHLRATVKTVIPLADFSGEATPVDIDPRFALTVRIVSANPAVGQFIDGSLITLAIHSPSVLFAGEAKEGKTYDFTLRRKVEGGKVGFSELRLVQKTREQLE